MLAKKSILMVPHIDQREVVVWFTADGCLLLLGYWCLKFRCLIDIIFSKPVATVQTYCISRKGYISFY